MLEQLSETLRAPLLLRDARAFSYEEIARTLGISLSVASMHIKRVREQLRRCFREFDSTLTP
jgi:DNA-directed RNA polymerase specialized sigma24 family protein